MVSRSLTEVFVLMRNNAIHSRQIFSEQSHEAERVQLMRSNSHDIESGIELRDANAPPPWTDALEEAHYAITRVRTKVSELVSRQERQIRRPALDDSSEQRHISRLSSEIARLFTHAHTHIAAIKRQAMHGSRTEQEVGRNVVTGLVTSLQEAAGTFRGARAHYLRSLTSREERSNKYFAAPHGGERSLGLDDADLLPGLTNNQTDLLFSLPSTSGAQNLIDDNQDFQKQILTQQQMLLMEQENTQIVAEREEEVNKIVRSITDLNDVFKDLATMVHEQGTVLDRIDYNIEQTQVQVHEGYKQLQKAERYQRKNRKMHCILILAVTSIVLVILLIIVKS